MLVLKSAKVGEELFDDGSFVVVVTPPIHQSTPVDTINGKSEMEIILISFANGLSVEHQTTESSIYDLELIGGYIKMKGPPYE